MAASGPLSGRVLIAGYGDLGSAVGRLLAGKGYTLFGLSRRAKPDADGIAFIQADVTQPETLGALAATDAEILLYCIAADAQTDDSYRLHYVDGLRQVLMALQNSRLQHVFFVSSTRVYGQDDGAWLSDEEPALPADFGGERLLQGEHVAASYGGPATVLRLSGIYGPGRTRMLRLAGQAPAQWPANSWTNRIHRDDAAAFIACLIQSRIEGKLPADCYLVTDNAPTPMHEVLNWLADRQGDSFERSPATVPAGGKRLCNRRLRDAGFQLKYPSYREGYAALMAADRSE